jgi:hypothetical protein
VARWYHHFTTTILVDTNSYPSSSFVQFIPGITAALEGGRGTAGGGGGGEDLSLPYWDDKLQVRHASACIRMIATIEHTVVGKENVFQWHWRHFFQELHEN